MWVARSARPQHEHPWWCLALSAACRQQDTGAGCACLYVAIKPKCAAVCSVLPQDARPAAVVSLQRVGYAAWARGPTLLVSTADCRICIYRRAALHINKALWRDLPGSLEIEAARLCQLCGARF